MRFVIGADYVAPRLAAHLVKAAAGRKVPREAAQPAASAVQSGAAARG
jgi:hypothetical protein